MRKTAIEIMHNTRIKSYPNGMQKITVASRDVYKERGWELVNSPKVPKVPIPKPQTKGTLSRSDSVKRAVDKVYDIIHMNMNSFRYFVTLTFDPDKINSKSTHAVIKAMRDFLKTMTTRCNMAYVFVPERHKSGAIHLHGVIGGNNIQLVDSGTRKAAGMEKPLKLETLRRKGINISTCKMVYNMPQWKYGFSTAIELYGDCMGVSNYVTKYITKDVCKIFGNYYYAGGHIERNVPFELCDTDYNDFEADNEVYCEPAHTRFKYLTVMN